jgi:hypothetical protein
MVIDCVTPAELTYFLDLIGTEYWCALKIVDDLLMSLIIFPTQAPPVVWEYEPITEMYCHG